MTNDSLNQCAECGGVIMQSHNLCRCEEMLPSGNNQAKNDKNEPNVTEREHLAPSKISVIEKALENGAKILADFKPEGERDKQAEWEGCYALLFKQLNDAAQEIRGLQSLTKPVSLAQVATECDNVPISHIKNVLDAAGVKYVD